MNFMNYDIELERYEKNPILKPRGHDWEALEVFNPAAVYINGKIHVLYRAVGDYKNYVSRFGHTVFDKDLNILERDEKPCFEPDMKIWWERSVEDPRITEIEGELYMTYVVTPTPAPPRKVRSRLKIPDPEESITRIGLAKIDKDFRNFTRLGIITPLEADERDTVLFPERINGKLAILHRPSRWIGANYGLKRPGIWFAYLNEEYWMSFDHKLVMGPQEVWESYKVGPGCPPIKTEKGWLLIYHGVDDDRKYRAGAVLLDLKEPWRVIARTKEPFMIPEKSYEIEGDVPEVVFPEGAVIIDNDLLIFYGGADKVCCAARMNLNKFVNYLSLEKFISVSRPAEPG
ncbi:MAG: glycosidase [Thermotogae bacterium]|nr:glycosidase [Thermotogota bacterium]